MFSTITLGSSYGTLALTETSPAQSFVEPLSLSEVKDYLKIPVRSPLDPAEDATLNVFITAAREYAEILQGRDLVRKQYDLSLDYWLCREIQLRRPLVSVDLMQYRDSGGAYTVMAEGVDYAVDKAKGVVVPMYGTIYPSFAPWPSSAILIRHTSGYVAVDAFWGDAGARIEIGMKMLISAWYANRIPFEAARGGISEFPYAVTACLSHGSILRAL